MDASKLRELTDWLIDGGRSAASPSRFMAECCERMVAAGLPLWRIGVFVRTLHPEIYGRNFIWKPGAEVEVGTVDFEILESPDFLTSPLIIVFQQGLEVRARTDEIGSSRFPIIEELRAEGVTDYIALPLPFIGGTVNGSSWTTKQPGGFTEEQLAALRSIVKPLARVIEIMTLSRTAASLLDTYVGNRAGERILGGQIRRGHTETMNAAIWLSDLRGFTSLSDRVPAETVVDVLNNYFDCQVTAIRKHGGEVLKYMGDGLLAVFPIDEYVGDERQVCSRVLEAAHEVPRQRRRPAVSDRRRRRTVSLRRRPACRTNSLRQYRRRQPARLHLHRPCGKSGGAAGKDRQPARPHGGGVGRLLPASAAAAGAISASFRSQDFQRRHGSMAWPTKNRRREAFRIRMKRSATRAREIYSSGSVVNSSG